MSDEKEIDDAIKQFDDYNTTSTHSKNGWELEIYKE